MKKNSINQEVWAKNHESETSNRLHDAPNRTKREKYIQARMKLCEIYLFEKVRKEAQKCRKCKPSH
jgi:hypothetical protein